jgi:hypothetical protein
MLKLWSQAFPVDGGLPSKATHGLFPEITNPLENLIHVYYIYTQKTMINIYMYVSLFTTRRYIIKP